jgi:hypothetical protein
MWIAELRDWIRNGMEFNEADFTYAMTIHSPEFKGFYDNNWKLRDQIHSHFARMIEHLRVRLTP